MNFIDTERDPWKLVSEAAEGEAPGFEPAPHALLTPAQWSAVRERWPAEMPVGLTLANDVDIESIAADLPRLDLIALHFPKWTDGRAYSQAHLLRSRWRWPGEIRAIGEVLVDMMPLLERNGFDSVVLRADQSRAAAERALTFFPAHYQGDVRGRPPHFANSAATEKQRTSA